eukprot:Hpha_TRINITY_DN6205_c0_g2::TRINITY_DN6205_c0_g2_i1::g.23557::m.23557
MAGAGTEYDTTDSESTEYNEENDGKINAYIRRRRKTVVKAKRRTTRWVYRVLLRIWSWWVWCTLMMESAAASLIPAGVTPQRPNRRRANSYIPPTAKDDDPPPLPLRRQRTAPLAVRPPSPSHSEEKSPTNSSSSGSSTETPRREVLQMQGSR